MARLAANVRKKPASKPSAKRSPSAMVSKAQEKAANAARKRLLKNPNAFTQFGSISKKATAVLAKYGIKAVEGSRTDKGKGAFKGLVDSTKTYEYEQKVIQKITDAFNKNEKTRWFFFESCVDLYVYTRIVPNKPKRLQIYQKLTRKL